MFARTARLCLRPPFAEDAAAIAAAIGDDAILRNLATAPAPYGRADAEAFINLAAAPELPRWIMMLRTAGVPRIVGGVGIHRREDDTLELGYWVARPYWGLGFATEGGRHAVRTARSLGLPKLTAGHFADNPASGAVLRKLGFRATGQIAPRFSLARGGDVACVLFEEGDGSDGNDAGVPPGMRRSDGFTSDLIAA